MDRPVPAAVSSPVRKVFFSPPSLVFAGLIAATLFSFSVGSESNPDNLKRVAAIIIAVAFIKTSLVIEYFMEVRHAYWPIRLIGLAWGMLVGFGILAFYPLGLF